MKAALALILLLAPAHDSWINSGGYRGPINREHCCGDDDCSVTSAQHVSSPAPGYRLSSGEFIPERETLPSLDGRYWRCKRPNGTTRCLFAPPESY